MLSSGERRSNEPQGEVAKGERRNNELSGQTPKNEDKASTHQANSTEILEI